MKDVLDILYDSQIQTNAYNRKVSTEIDTIKAKKMMPNQNSPASCWKIKKYVSMVLWIL